MLTIKLHFCKIIDTKLLLRLTGTKLFQVNSVSFAPDYLELEKSPKYYLAHLNYKSNAKK